jgi:hypothetical protein
VAVVLLASAGVSPGDATLVALLGYLTGQGPALLGGILQISSREKPASKAACPQRPEIEREPMFPLQV